ncbi:hypothetical protein QUS15_24965 [Escherichia coli]|nr:MULTISPECIES: hypothetical protein [Gammaproteobacteria]MCU2329979.1 hypothetical protein [Enterobacter hormaechei subsp. steigerwaltii]HAS0789570.1 hypothetical protein [Enterobacter hormaechei subsp. xiangfangensis]MDD1412688.1 hypothetical protein [Escherichia coli]MDM8048184.1 hypothetical protein [Escherichia coli]MDO2402228.1 hypothetical protein [Enterobacter hormaechei]
MNNTHYSQFPPEYGFKPDLMPAGQSMNQTEAQTQEQREPGMKLVAYGGKYAFQCQQSNTIAGWQTIQFESAPKSSSSPSDRTYNWSKKIAFQITDTELPLLVAVLLGFLPAIRFDLHGPEKNKWLEIINQGPNFYIKSGMGSTLHSAPVTLVDASMFGLLALNQYTANFPLLSSDAVLASVKMLARQSFENKTYKIPKEPQKSGYHHQGA